MLKYYNNEYTILCEETCSDIMYIDDCNLPFENSEIKYHCTARAMDSIDQPDQLLENYRGYFGFHDQNLQSWINNEGIYLSYGSFKENATDEDVMEIAHEIIKTCDRIGIKYKWSGTIDEKIHLLSTVNNNKMFEGDPYYLKINGYLHDSMGNKITTFSGPVKC